MALLGFSRRFLARSVVLYCSLELLSIFDSVSTSTDSHRNSPASGFAEALILPPKDKIAMGMVDDLVKDCHEFAANSASICCWEFDSVCEYQVANSIFTSLVRHGTDRTQRLFFPQCANHQGELEHMSSLLNRNSYLLGGIRTAVTHWPESPASMISIDWDPREQPVSEDEDPSTASRLEYKPDDRVIRDSIVQDMELWVEETLCKHGLCPYTRSMSLGAIGLEHFGIRPGPVVVRHASDVLIEDGQQGNDGAPCNGVSSTTTPAAVLGKLFWDGVAELMEQPETEVSTLLLCAPSAHYDDDFEAFYRCLDDLVEPMGRVSFEKVGRVWFHPSYTLEQVGYSKGGHTLPVDVVSGYMDDYMKKHPGARRPDPHDMARGHDRTRRTPHACINLLRGSQLKAAQGNEQNRKHIYARNIIKMLEVENSDLPKLAA